MPFFPLNTHALAQPHLIGRLTATIFILALIPIWLVNAAIALLTRRECLTVTLASDALGRQIRQFHFTCGGFRQSAILLNIFNGDMAWCGVSLKSHCEQPISEEIINFPAGLFSLYDLHTLTGLREANHGELIVQHYRSDGLKFNVALVLRTLVAQFLYSGGQLLTPSHYRLFGVDINNVTMKQAVNCIIAPRLLMRTKLCFFINAHSINTRYDQRGFAKTLAQADYRFADGSGIRLASQKVGVRLKDNVNGTDLLPHLCKAAAKKGRSIYLLGAGTDVATATASNLQRTYPNLKIAGCQDGYFKEEETDQVINAINRSGASVLLVALGSPLQEEWLVRHRDQLQVTTALAVGGLFDFYSGNIARAPRWIRELGMEWTWRLMQEPKTKFRRYVIGNPMFLFRTFFLAK